MFHLLELTFNQQLTITIIDKGLFALLIVIATFAVNRVLETYKSTKARNNEIMKIRIAAMNETWEKIYSWIAESNYTMGDVMMGYKDLNSARTEVLTKSDDVFKAIEKNRFLAGNLFSNDCLSYAGKFHEYYMNVEADWDSSGKYKQMKDSGESIISSLDKYLNSMSENKIIKPKWTIKKFLKS